jgi:hypothetical protein
MLASIQLLLFLLLLVAVPCPHGRADAERRHRRPPSATVEEDEEGLSVWQTMYTMVPLRCGIIPRQVARAIYSYIVLFCHQDFTVSSDGFWPSNRLPRSQRILTARQGDGVQLPVALILRNLSVGTSRRMGASTL